MIKKPQTHISHMPTPDDEELYEKVKRQAKRKFKVWPSAYGSGWLVREYKRRGGTFSGEAGSGVGRWFREEWVQVIPYLQRGKMVACGSRNKQTKACRPLIRVDDDTPATIDELVEMHGRKTVLLLARAKNEDMEGRVFWERGKFYSSE